MNVKLDKEQIERLLMLLDIDLHFTRGAIHNNSTGTKINDINRQCALIMSIQIELQNTLKENTTTPSS